MLETVFSIVVVLSGYSIFLLTRFDEVKIDRREDLSLPNTMSHFEQWLLSNLLQK